MPDSSALPPALVLCAVLLVPAPAGAGVVQEDANRPAFEARRVERGPLIDGRLDDAVWVGAPVVSEFRQKEPVEGQEASELTRVRVVYDQFRLYIGVELLDSEPVQIRASELRRDNSLASDDTFAVVLDTFHDHRNAFLFRVNPRGTRFDGIIRNESPYVNSDWDEQWTAAAAITAQGWTAELAIPFKILRFASAQEQVWGINFERVIKRKNELIYWSAWDRNFGFHHVSQAGHLTGLRDIKQAERVRLRPYVMAGSEKLDAIPGPRGTRLFGEVGIDDLKVAVTSNLTADLTINADFAQTEVDAQRVNLTRFSLFFPEKRQFFIEGAESLRMGVGLLHFGPPPLELFYSRTVGLSEAGEPIPVLGGGKLTGKVAGFDLGILSVQTDKAHNRPGENFAVARVRKELLGRSYIGSIFTNRQGGGDFTRVVGADARFVFRTYLTVAGLMAKSFAPGVDGQQWARQLGAEWRDDFLELGANYLEVDPRFDSGAGFVLRRDRMMGTRLSVKPRPGGKLVRQFEITPSAVYYHDAAGTLQTRRARFQFATSFQSGDRLEFALENDVEQLPRRFPVGPGVVLPAGVYEWNAAGVSFHSFMGRKVAGAVRADVGGFYNGTKRSLELAGVIRPNKNLMFNPSYGLNDVNLREGSFKTYLAGLRVDVSFTTNLLTAAYLQYNSSGNLAAIQLRFNYIFRTIDNFYIVYNETRFTEGFFADRANKSLVVKVTYSLHR